MREWINDERLALRFTHNVDRTSSTLAVALGIFGGDNDIGDGRKPPGQLHWRLPYISHKEVDKRSAMCRACEPVRETPMGGGTSQLAHSLVLLEKTVAKAKPGLRRKYNRTRRSA